MWFLGGSEWFWAIFLCLPVKRNRRLHTTETAVNPNSALITSILDKSEDRGPFYAFFPQKRRNVTFLPSEITHFCHQRPMYQIQQSRSFTIHDTTIFATRPDFHALPSDWTIVVMANSSNDPHPGRVHHIASWPWSACIFAFQVKLAVEEWLKCKWHDFVFFLEKVYQWSLKSNRTFMAWCHLLRNGHISTFYFQLALQKSTSFRSSSTTKTP